VAQNRLKEIPGVGEATSPDGSYCDVRVTKWTSRRLEACARHGVAVEVNSNLGVWIYQRLHQRALELRCLMSINPDAHSTAEIDLTHGASKWHEKAVYHRIACSIVSSYPPFIQYLAEPTSESEKHSKTAIDVSAG
jgi:hypothetical protein